MTKHGIATEKWYHSRRYGVIKWLEESAGTRGLRWGIVHDWDLGTIWMDEDVSHCTY
jgi:hypothetical protein